MPASFTADVAKFVNKTEQRLHWIATGTMQDVFELMTKTQPSIRYIGTYEEGKVPVLTGELIGSFVVFVNSDPIHYGQVDTQINWPPIDRMDSISGVFQADYAGLVEYGDGKFPGRFFVRNAVLQLPTILQKYVNFFAGA